MSQNYSIRQQSSLEEQSLFHIGDYFECQTKSGYYEICEIIHLRYSRFKIPEYYIHYLNCDKRLDEWVTPDRLRVINHFSKKSSHLKRSLRCESESGVFSDDPLEISLQLKTKIRNIDYIQLGEYEISAWYYSPYPEPYHIANILYICEYCFKYFKYTSSILKHRSSCRWRHPPGNEIYRSNISHTSVFEVDGKQFKLYCQNLCLLSKLFLDHKTLYYDTSSFRFYILTHFDNNGFHLIGYFSKEKYSFENYNLSCILILPHYQKMGYGTFLIALSYELSKRENIIGTPERPLSDLGKRLYCSYWSFVLLSTLKEHPDISLANLSVLTCIKHDDIILTLKSLNLLSWYKDHYSIKYNEKLVEQSFSFFSGSKKTLFDHKLLVCNQNIGRKN